VVVEYLRGEEILYLFGAFYGFGGGLAWNEVLLLLNRDKINNLTIND
jgi:hypothetical protein